MMMMTMGGEENPHFCVESDKDNGVKVGDTVNVKAKVIKTEQAQEPDGGIAYINHYEVIEINGKPPEEEDPNESPEVEDDYKELEKTVDEEMSKSQGNEEGEE